MADSISSSYSLTMNWQFSDGDTRTQSVKNPRDNLTDADLQAYRDYIAGKHALVGDKDGAELSATKPMASAYVEEKSKLNLDISGE